MWDAKWERRRLNPLAIKSKKGTSVITGGFVAKCSFLQKKGRLGFVKLTSVYIELELFYTWNINYIAVKKCGFRNIEMFLFILTAKKTKDFKISFLTVRVWETFPELNILGRY